MDIFKSSAFTWWQMGMFKLGLLSIGIAVGAYWHDVFLPYVSWLVILGLVLGVYVVFVWSRNK